MNSFFVTFARAFVVPLVFVFIGVCLAATACAPVEAGDEGFAQSSGTVGESTMFGRGQINIITRGGLNHEFQVELATKTAQHRRGLMFRRHLEDGHGMLFDYTTARRIVMWMKNTPISLDMLFADAHGRVVHIATDTQPFSQKLIPTPMPVRYVLEVPAGTVKALGLALGDQFHIP